MEEVCKHLKASLKAAVVLDLAALDRQKVEPDDSVQLELDGVRLKTGLKLLLDQVGLTYRVVAEDNLMIITDREGSEDLAERVLAELRALHRDLHELQDAVDELRESMGDEGEEGLRVHKPTIIEEMPERGGEKPESLPARPEKPRQKSEGAQAPGGTPDPVSRSTGRPAPSHLIRLRPAVLRGSVPGWGACRRKVASVGGPWIRIRESPSCEITMRQSSAAKPDPPLAEDAANPEGPRRPEARAPRRSRAATPGHSWFSEPRSVVWIALASAVLFGGWRKLHQGWRARKAVVRLGDPGASPAEIEAVAEHGRAGVWELLRIFSSTQSEPQRRAAGVALARLWRLDHLVAEEEQAVVRRGYAVTWSARRRLPRALANPVPISVSYEVPFLEDGANRVGPSNLEWSHRVLGARRAALEEDSPWTPGPGHVTFKIFPRDFETNGPHRLVLATRVRTTGLTDSWEIELPHIPFNFEFDPALQLDAILTLPDSIRDEAIARAIRLEPAPPEDGKPAKYLSLGSDWSLRNPPRLAVTTPLPCDLAHAISLELDGSGARLPAGQLVLSGQGMPQHHPADRNAGIRLFDLEPIPALPADVFDRPGVRRMRVSLQADPGGGWADPEIRSIWPGSTLTDWVDVEIMRR